MWRTHGQPFLGAHEWPACSYEEDPRFNMKAFLVMALWPSTWT